jgi:hypothetical protein
VREPVLAILLAVGLAGCGGDGGSEDAFCATARQFAADNPATVFDRYDDTDPGAAAELLRSEAARIREWAGDAPGEIDQDIEAIADVADELADAFESPPESDDRAAELAERFSTVEDASVRVTEFARTRCGVDLDPVSSSTAPSSASTAPP